MLQTPGLQDLFFMQIWRL